MAVSRRGLFGPGQFYREALAIAVPIMLQQLIQSLVSLVDNFMVSGLGDVCMSGVNVAGQVLFIFMVFLNAICMSGGIFMTQFFGAENKEGMQQAFRFKLAAGLAAFIPYVLVCVVFPRQVLSLMLIGNSQADLILDQAVQYIRIMFWMGIPMTISVSIASSMRDMGQVRIPLVITVIATLVNTTFNWLLIYGNLGFPRLDVRGAALATVIARLVEFVIFLAVYIRMKPDFAVRLSDLLKIDRSLFKEIFKKSALVLFCEMVWVFSETITTAIYNGRGGAVHVCIETGRLLSRYDAIMLANLHPEIPVDRHIMWRRLRFWMICRGRRRHGDPYSRARDAPSRLFQRLGCSY